MSDDTNYDSYPCQAVTCGQPMTEGRHYWEVEFTTSGGSISAKLKSEVLAGAVRPGQNCDNTGSIEASSTSHFMLISDGDNSVNLYGNGKSHVCFGAGCDGDVSHVDEGEEYVFKVGPSAWVS